MSENKLKNVSSAVTASVGWDIYNLISRYRPPIEGAFYDRIWAACDRAAAPIRYRRREWNQ